MAITDIFTVDPLIKRIKRMTEIEKQMANLATKRRASVRESEALQSEWENLFRECKTLKKKGKL